MNAVIEISERKPLRVLLMANIPWDNAVSAYALDLGLGLIDAGHEVALAVKPGSPIEQRALAREFS